MWRFKRLISLLRQHGGGHCFTRAEGFSATAIPYQWQGVSGMRKQQSGGFKSHGGAAPWVAATQRFDRQGLRACVFFGSAHLYLCTVKLRSDKFFPPFSTGVTIGSRVFCASREPLSTLIDIGFLANQTLAQKCSSAVWGVRITGSVPDDGLRVQIGSFWRTHSP